MFDVQRDLLPGSAPISLKAHTGKKVKSKHCSAFTSLNRYCAGSSVAIIQCKDVSVAHILNLFKCL